MIQKIDPNKASGPDNLPGRLFKEVTAEIAPSISQLFNLSPAVGNFPTQRKLANLSPVYKKDGPTLVNNYRSISLLCMHSKVFERCICNHCFPFPSPKLYHLQHGFLKNKSTTTQLVQVYRDIFQSLPKGHEVDTRFLDLSKAFDRVSHGKLI